MRYSYVRGNALETPRNPLYEYHWGYHGGYHGASEGCSRHVEKHRVCAQTNTECASTNTECASRNTRCKLRRAPSVRSWYIDTYREYMHGYRLRYHPDNTPTTGDSKG